MDRFERQRRLFGDLGQASLRRLHVAVVGASGLGSPTVRQVALLGVGHISVIDPGVVKQSGRNRMDGLRSWDPDGTPKVEVMARMATEIDPRIQVEALQEDAAGNRATAAIESASWLVGCVDNDAARLQLLQVSSQSGVPYIDLATEVSTRGQPVWGGRVCVMVDPDQGCLLCRGLLDQEDIRRFSDDSDARRDQADIYGIEAELLGDSGPSVAPLNNIVSACGVHELMVAATGLRRPVPSLVYRGGFGIVGHGNEQPEAGCYYCQQRRAAQRSRQALASTK